MNNNEEIQKTITAVNGFHAWCWKWLKTGFEQFISHTVKGGVFYLLWTYVYVEEWVALPIFTWYQWVLISLGMAIIKSNLTSTTISLKIPSPLNSVMSTPIPPEPEKIETD